MRNLWVYRPVQQRDSRSATNGCRAASTHRHTYQRQQAIEGHNSWAHMAYKADLLAGDDAQGHTDERRWALKDTQGRIYEGQRAYVEGHICERQRAHNGIP